MNIEQLTPFLADTVKRISGIEDMQPDQPVKDALDSLDIIEAMMEVEREFSVNIDDAAPVFENSRMTVSEFADAIMENHTQNNRTK